MRNKKGEIYVTVCVFMLIIFMIFSAVFTFASAITMIKVQESNTEIVFDSFVANNSILIFNNIKMGRNATDHVNTANFCSVSFFFIDEIYCRFFLFYMELISVY